MQREANKRLQAALEGDINAFQSLFAAFQPQLKSYLYRLLADRNDVDDLTQDTFVKAFDKLSTFKGNSTLKTWVFRIATNLAYDFLKRRKRWKSDAQDTAKAYAEDSPEMQRLFWFTHQNAPAGQYDIKEHIDFCFTCIAKTLSISHQVALILKDVYSFPRKDISQILDKTEGVVKHLLFEARKTMVDVFDHRCALINKAGVCHQCTELNGIYNPKQNAQKALMKIDMVAVSEESSSERLYELRAALVRAIDPLQSEGADLQDVIMQCTRASIGEIG
ncbi:MAG: RNA polymerase sigma factor [Bacteroidota bacterium]